MHIARRFTTAGQDPYTAVRFRTATSAFDRMAGARTYGGWMGGDGMY